MTIKEARNLAGLTQQKMSDILEIPKRTIQKWEGGFATPPKYVEDFVLEKLLKIAEEKNK